MRAVVDTEVEIAASPGHVWGYVTDWPRQAEWVPLTRVESDGAAQLGGRIHAWTGVGPVGFWDTMTITSWETSVDGSGRCEVLHTGSVVRGEGEFAVSGRGSHACVFTWSERLVVPGGRAGALAWKAVEPLVQRGVDRAIRQLAVRAEQSYVTS